jgi:hypothetical protein
MERRAQTMDLLFMIGSACFAVAALPGFSSAVPYEVVAAVFFIGSLFFTSAASLQLSLSRDERSTGPWWRDPAWAAAAVQLVGTVWFNVNTFAARRTDLDTRQEDLRIWTPDIIGSICFLAASAFAIVALEDRSWGADRPWWVATLNMLGSVLFMAAAIASFVLPDDGSLLDATVANTGTSLGALCFLVAAGIDLAGLRQQVPQTA